MKNTPLAKTVYSKEIKLDTSGCALMIEGRHIVDSLNREMAFIRIISDTLDSDDSILHIEKDTIIYTTRYINLSLCQKIPSFIEREGDTLLISGFVYNTGSAEGGRGKPTVIFKINYRDTSSFH